MNFRFEELYKPEQNLYLNTSPVMIEAGALLRDTKTGNILTQLKLRNICEKQIVACYVRIRAFEPDGTADVGDRH